MATTADVNQQVKQLTEKLRQTIDVFVGKYGVLWVINFLETDFIPNLSERCRDAYPDESDRNEVVADFTKSIISYVMVTYHDQTQLA